MALAHVPKQKETMEKNIVLDQLVPMCPNVRRSPLAGKAFKK